ncbi:MAG TPA: hypothetical protein VHN77_05135 [Phycisphaerales bacterium]|nr:hypothetical protein [Phycisphaerales bacterium]
MKSTFAIIMAASVASTAAAQTYRLVDLGTIAGESHAFLVSDTGRVVGSSTKVSAHFVGAELGTGPASIGGVPGYGETAVFAVDADDNALGVSYSLGGLITQAFRNDGTSAAALGGFTPRAVNASGVIAGTAHTHDVNGFVLPQACSFSGGVLAMLPTLGGVTGQAFGVDELGRIFGSSTTLREAASRPCMWSGGVARDLGTLSASASATGQAWGAQGNGVVGASQNASGIFRATRWTLDSGGAVVSRVDMGGLSPTTPSYAYAVNAAGDAVGTSGFHAVVYSAGGAVDLNTVIEGGAGPWTLEKAWSISASGVIVGDGSLLGFPRAFALYPCSGACCDDIDFNRDGLFPDTVDIDAFLSVFSGAPCATPSCGDIDFNNDGLFPDTMDIDALLNVFSGGTCVR